LGPIYRVHSSNKHAQGRDTSAPTNNAETAIGAI